MKHDVLYKYIVLIDIVLSMGVLVVGIYGLL